MSNKPISVFKLEDIIKEHPNATNQELGELLAKKEGRKTPYTSGSISVALRRWQRAIKK